MSVILVFHYYEAAPLHDGRRDGRLLQSYHFPCRQRRVGHGKIGQAQNEKKGGIYQCGAIRHQHVTQTHVSTLEEEAP
jgi:hypothetical protein